MQHWITLASQLDGKGCPTQSLKKTWLASKDTWQCPALVWPRLLRLMDKIGLMTTTFTVKSMVLRLWNTGKWKHADWSAFMACSCKRSTYVDGQRTEPSTCCEWPWNKLSLWIVQLKQFGVLMLMTRFEHGDQSSLWSTEHRSNASTCPPAFVALEWHKINLKTSSGACIGGFGAGCQTTNLGWSWSSNVRDVM